MPKRNNILIVDDDPKIASTLARMLKSMHEATIAHSGEEALPLLTQTQFDLVLLDVHLPKMDGYDVLEAVKDRYPHLPVVMLTGFGSIDSAVYAMKHGAFDYLQKPILYEQLVESVKKALQHARREQQRQKALVKAHRLLEAGLQKLDQFAPDGDDLFLPESDIEPSTPTAEPGRYLQKGPLLIDLYRREATLNEAPLDLTAGEYDLLLCLAQNAPRVMDPQEVVQKTRGFECSLHEARELIRWQIYLLRQKVEADPSVPKYIINVRGQGYMWAAA